MDVGTSIDNVFPFPFLEEDLQESETVRTHFQLYYTNLDKPPSAKRSKGMMSVAWMYLQLFMTALDLYLYMFVTRRCLCQIGLDLESPMITICEHC